MKIQDVIAPSPNSGAQEAEIEVSMVDIKPGTPSIQTKGLPYGHASDLMVGIELAVRAHGLDIFSVTTRGPTIEDSAALAVEELKHWADGISVALPELADRMRRMLLKSGAK